MSTESISLNPRNNRIYYMDIFRSFGIILMVMGHIGYGNRFDFFIHAFHMPMFFWISGFLFHHRTKAELSFQSFLSKKAKSLLLPYLTFGISHYILSIIRALRSHDSFDLFPLIHLFSVNTEGLPICGALWFLTALFFTDVLFFLIDRYITNRALMSVTIILITLIGNYAKTIFPFTLPFALAPSFVGIGLYYIGYLFKKYDNQPMLQTLMNLPWIPTIVLGIITTILIFSNGYINMRTGMYAMIPLFWINSILSIVVGVNIAKLLSKYIQNNFIGKWLISVGKDSIVYVCLNQLVIMIAYKIASYFPLPGYLYIRSMFILIITLTMLYIIGKIFMNTKLKLFVGR